MFHRLITTENKIIVSFVLLASMAWVGASPFFDQAWAFWAIGITIDIIRPQFVIGFLNKTPDNYSYTGVPVSTMLTDVSSVCVTHRKIT
jgi:low temperature requirement protein LtrA